MDKVLIFGINGFTGLHFEQYILQNGLETKFEYLGVDKEINRNSSIRCLKVDLLQTDSILDLIVKETPDYVINLVGIFQSNIFNTLFAINAGITQKLFEAILKVKKSLKKVLLIGSAAEYGIPSSLPINEEMPLHPVNWYGLTKVFQTDIAQYYFQNHNIPINIARTFNIIGKGISPALSIGGFIERISNAKNGDAIEVGNIVTKRDFLDINDIIDAYWKLLLMGRPGEVYNVCRGESVNIKDILTHLIKESQKSIRINVNKAFFKENDVPDIYGDNKKLIYDTNWKPKIGIFESLTKSL